MNNSKERSWIEINTKNLEYNINQIKQIIPKTTQIMAVVKANAYGHDSIIISTKLQEIGINDFAVATLQEAITLRQNNIKKITRNRNKRLCSSNSTRSHKVKRKQYNRKYLNIGLHRARRITNSNKQ